MEIAAGENYNLTVTSIEEDCFLLNNQIPLNKEKHLAGLRVGENISVFVYHNSEGILVATTQKPYAKVGELATLKVIDMSAAGAFLDWGLPKDLLLPRSFHEDDLQKGDYCLVKILRDHTGRVIAKEKLEDELSNENLNIKELDVVEMVMYQETPLGYQMIINGKHLGLLHKNETFKDLYAGDKVEGFIKKIKEDNKIDVVLGRPGYKRVISESEPILSALNKANGFLPYHDKSSAEEIQKVFGMSKKTFKMSIGALYKQKKIVITNDGISLVK